MAPSAFSVSTPPTIPTLEDDPSSSSTALLMSPSPSPSSSSSTLSMDTIEIPQYFLCPISLQIMEDPVTTITGITYDRRSIERWLLLDHHTTCPATNQPLSKDSPLTPNHTLRRLIQYWCTVKGVDRIPTPRTPLDSPRAANLLLDLSLPHLKLISALASDSESNRRCIIHAGAATSIVKLIKNPKTDPLLLQEALTVLQSLKVPDDFLKPLVADNFDLLETLTSTLSNKNTNELRSAAILALKLVMEFANPSLLERLKLGFFHAVTSVLRERISQQATKAALQVLMHACPERRNRTRMVEAGAVTELIELELTAPDRRTTEFVLGVLDNLCGCADGRAEIVGHAAGIAVVTKRLLRVSATADDSAVGILLTLCRNSGTNLVAQEMLKVGAVAKFCCILQTDCSSFLKEKIRAVLRLHSRVWKDSPCIPLYLERLTLHSKPRCRFLNSN